MALTCNAFLFLLRKGTAFAVGILISLSSMFRWFSTLRQVQKWLYDQEQIPNWKSFLILVYCVPLFGIPVMMLHEIYDVTQF